MSGSRVSAGVTGAARPVRAARVGLLVGALGLVTLSVPPSHAGFLSDLFKGSTKASPAKSETPAKAHAAAPPKHAASRKRETPVTREIAPKQAVAAMPLSSRPVAPGCDPAKFRLVIDVGHTAKSEGAMSARNVPEFEFNLRLSQRLVEKLKSEGFSQVKLLVTEGNARPSLAARVASANRLSADLFLSIHHDSVPDKMMENWDFEGRKSHFSDRFAGYGLFVSRRNPDFDTSLKFAHLIGTQMRAQGIKFADQYALPVMGKYRHDLLDRDAGVYRYDNLIVLMKTKMPAALLEAGSIINRDEELQMRSPERQARTVVAVATAVKQFCGLAPAPSETAPDAQAKVDH